MLLSVSVKNKCFDRAGAEGNRPWRQVDSIWWDATYEDFGLKKDARSIQGLLQFCDILGGPKFEVRVNINDPVRARAGTGARPPASTSTGETSPTSGSPPRSSRT